MLGFYTNFLILLYIQENAFVKRVAGFHRFHEHSSANGDLRPADAADSGAIAQIGIYEKLLVQLLLAQNAFYLRGMNENARISAKNLELGRTRSFCQKITIKFIWNRY